MRKELEEMNDMVSGIKRQVGLLLMLTGLLHMVLVLFSNRKQLQSIVADGFWNTVADGQWERTTAFWFLMVGFMLIILGYTADWLMKKKGIAPPAAFGWMLLTVCVVGVVVMPASGF
jgi:hypothetical protein